MFGAEIKLVSQDDAVYYPGQSSLSIGAMKNNGFKSALDFQNRQLAVCLEKLAAQQKLLAVVKAALPPALAQQAVHCVVSGASCLLVYCESASWASQIRFFNRAILEKLHSVGLNHLTRLQVRIAAPIAGPAKLKRQARLPSAESIGLLTRHLPSGAARDELDTALARLGTTLSKRLRER